MDDNRKAYKKISDKKVKNLIKYLAVKHNLEEQHIKDIILYQFLNARKVMSSGSWETVFLEQLGKFKFNQHTFNRHFQRVSRQSEERQKEIQDLLAKENEDNASK